LKLRKELSARELEDLQSSLARRLGDSSVPTLPQVAVKVIELVGDASAGMREFARVIETDQALTGRLLRMANSVMYAQRAPVTELNRAMVLMGLERLKAVALGFHLSQATMKDEGEFSTKRVWTQSIFRAWLAFHLCEKLDRKKTGEAFIVGLMLDAALPLMPKLAGADYTLCVRSGVAPGAQYLDEFEKLPFTHVDLVRALCVLWRLPEALARPIGAHHTRPESVNISNSASLLQGIAYFVGSLRLLPGDGMGATPEKSGAEQARRLFQIEPAELEPIIAAAARDFAASKAIFSHVMDPGLTLEQILATVNEELNETVEDLVTESLEREQKTGPIRFQINDLILEMEPAARGLVKVYIADGSGARLFSEDIDPVGKSGTDLRGMLMLHEASAEQLEHVVAEMRKLAA